MEDKARDNTEFPVVLGYRMSVLVRASLTMAVLLVPYGIVQEVWMIWHKWMPGWLLPMQIPLLIIALWLIAWSTAWSVVSADCLAEGMRCRMVIGAGRFIPWGQVREFRRSIRSPVHSLESLRICLLRTDDRIPYCFHLDKQSMARFIAILRETSNARVIGFE